MYTINQFVSNEIISALGWTMVNIFWQGLVLALLLWIFLRLFRNLSSHFRYLAAISSLVMIIGLSIFNFVNCYKPVQNHNALVVSQNLNTGLSINELNELLGVDADTKTSVAFITEKFKNLDGYFPLLINVWCIGVVFFILRFLIGTFYVQRLKSRSTANIDYSWIKRFQSIEKRISLKKGVRYLESKIVKIPLVLGYLKPVVIIPFGMLSGIPANQVEAIIAHELAHIKRNDYLVNIIQTIVEIIYFFHPAVWYISSAISTERENCCDDIALTVCEGSLTYARALVSVQELIPEMNYSAVAFAGNKKQLLNRIKRLIMEPKTNSNFTDRIIATAVLLVGIVATTVTVNLKAETSVAGAIDDNSIYVAGITMPSPKKPVVFNTPKIEKTVVKDTSKIKGKSYDIEIHNNTISRSITDSDGKTKNMKFVLKNGVVSEMYIDGKKVPESELANYQPEVDKTIADIKEAKEDIKKAMKEVEEIDFEKIREEVEEAMKDVQIDMENVRIEVAKALDEAQKVDVEEIMREVQESLKEIDFDEELFNIQKSLSEIENINMEEIQRQMEETRKHLQEINIEEIMAQIEIDKENLKIEIDMETFEKEMQKVKEEIAKIDMEQIRVEVEENFNHMDKEKILDEMEKELQKLEGLELDKK